VGVLGCKIIDPNRVAYHHDSQRCGVLRAAAFDADRSKLAMSSSGVEWDAEGVSLGAPPKAAQTLLPQVWSTKPVPSRIWSPGGQQ